MRAINILISPSLSQLFPFLFGGTFIEGIPFLWIGLEINEFPFLFGGTFIEGRERQGTPPVARIISLPFRRDFH